MKRAVLKITSEALVAIFQNGHRETFVTEGLPKDSRIVDVRKPFGATFLEIVLESDDFPDIPEGCAIDAYSDDVIPHVVIIVRGKHCYECEEDDTLRTLL